jgi:hypothetical protein
MGFFDFISNMSLYCGNPKSVTRLNMRYSYLIAPIADELVDAKVLDIAAHDGRWSYALASAGARKVHGVEARPELVAAFSDYPDSEFKKRINLEVGDLYDVLDRLVLKEERYDVVALFGIFYHVMDHFRILKQIQKLRPKLVIIDSEFMTNPNPYIQLIKERTDNCLNAVAQIEGQEFAIKGVPSSAAMEQMAKALGFSTIWLPWEALPVEDRIGVSDYFRKGNMLRRTCILVRSDSEVSHAEP